MNTFIYSMVGLLIGVLTASTMSIDNSNVTPVIYLSVIIVFTLAGALTGKAEYNSDQYKGRDSG
jgi:uncharacterized membrane protein AbrB (regulator of aidB expression)